MTTVVSYCTPAPGSIPGEWHQFGDPVEVSARSISPIYAFLGLIRSVVVAAVGIWLRLRPMTTSPPSSLIAF